MHVTARGSVSVSTGHNTGNHVALRSDDRKELADKVVSLDS
jgi:hypothetical protein